MRKAYILALPGNTTSNEMFQPVVGIAAYAVASYYYKHYAVIEVKFAFVVLSTFRNH